MEFDYMRIKNSKKAYTLAEIMIVILILTVIFAAFAPFFTKRAVKNYNNTGIWSWFNDSHYNAGKTTHSGELFFGLTPDNQDEVKNVFVPQSKLVIRSGIQNSNEIQRQIQFRFGRKLTDPNKKLAGDFAGTWYADGKNILLGGEYAVLNHGSNVEFKYLEPDEAKNNVSIGYGALNSLLKSKGNVAVGYNSLYRLTGYKVINEERMSAGLYYPMTIDESTDSNYGNNVSVGYNAGFATIGSNNVFVGKNAGEEYKTSGNIAIGYYNGSTLYNKPDENKPIDIGYLAYKSPDDNSNNIFIGAFSGQEAFKYFGYNNIGIGYNALTRITSGYNNIAIGAHALENATTGYNNTAIGYGACAEVKEASNKTCIGYNSGPHLSKFSVDEFNRYPDPSLPATLPLYEKSDDRYKYDHGIFVTDWIHNKDFYKDFANDSQMRTYIGSKPYKYGGDAVLEIHNLNTYNNGYMGLTDTSPFNVTTIVNGNLIVRGRAYFTVGSSLHHFYDGIINDSTARQKMQLTYKLKPGTVTSYYGYATSSDPYYARCTTGSSNTYDGINPKCINLKSKAATSDRRLKKITSKNTAGLKQLRKLKVYSFTFKNDKNKTPQVGVLAQELMKVFPTAVFQDEKGYYKIRWDEMFYAVINSIKEIDKRVASIIKRAAKIEPQITKLESENTVLKSQVETLTQRVNKLKAQ